MNLSCATEKGLPFFAAARKPPRLRGRRPNFPAQPKASCLMPTEGRRRLPSLSAFCLANRADAATCRGAVREASASFHAANHGALQKQRGSFLTVAAPSLLVFCIRLFVGGVSHRDTFAERAVFHSRALASEPRKNGAVSSCFRSVTFTDTSFN